MYTYVFYKILANPMHDSFVCCILWLGRIMKQDQLLTKVNDRKKYVVTLRPRGTKPLQWNRYENTLTLTL